MGYDYDNSKPDKVQTEVVLRHSYCYKYPSQPQFPNFVLFTIYSPKAAPEPNEMSPVEQLFQEDLILEFSENISSQGNVCKLFKLRI